MKWKQFLMVVFGVSIVVANLTAAKLAWFVLPYIGGVAVPAGFVAMGVAFLCSDALVEMYGAESAHTAVNVTIGALVVAWGLVYASILMPAAPFYEQAEAFTTIFGASSTIVVAGVLTMIVSQHLDVWVFGKLKDVTEGKWKFVRNVGSTSVSQLVDTALFVVLGFIVLPQFLGGATQPFGVVVGLIVGQYVVKLLVAALDTPLFYALTYRSD